MKICLNCDDKLLDAAKNVCFVVQMQKNFLVLSVVVQV